MDKLIERFLEHLELAAYSPATRSTYCLNLRLFRRWAGARGVHLVSQVTPRLLHEYQVALLHDKGPTGQPLSVSTRELRLVALRSFFNWCVQQGIVLIDPARKLTLPRRRQTLPRRILKPAEVRQLLEEPDLRTIIGFRDRTIIELLYSTGVRGGEAAALTVDDVGLERGLLHVQGKGKRQRALPLGETARAYLAEYLRAVRPRLAAQAQVKALFLSTKQGRPLRRKDITARVVLYARRAGLGQVTPHLIRHTVATEMLKGGADLRHIQSLLGHAKLSTTQRYTRVVVQDLQKVHGRTHPRETGRTR